MQILLAPVILAGLIVSKQEFDPDFFDDKALLNTLLCVGIDAYESLPKYCKKENPASQSAALCWVSVAIAKKIKEMPPAQDIASLESSAVFQIAKETGDITTLSEML